MSAAWRHVTQQTFPDLRKTIRFGHIVDILQDKFTSAKSCCWLNVTIIQETIPIRTQLMWHIDFRLEYQMDQIRKCLYILTSPPTANLNTVKQPKHYETQR